MISGIGLLLAAGLDAVPGGQPFSLDDLARVRGVADPEVSPDGARVAYTVRTTDLKEDKHETHIWMTSWDGKETVRLTTGKESETEPRWSPDGRFLAFLSDRGDDSDEEQLWILPRSGGEAEKFTEQKGGVEDFAWSPDGKRLVLVVSDPDPNAPAEKEEGEEAEDEEADRHRPLPVQARRLRLPRGAAQAPLPPRPRQPQGRAADDRKLRRAGARLVARRQDDRLRLQAGDRPGSHRQLGRLRDRAARRRRGAQADDLRGLGQRPRVGRQPALVEPGQQAHRVRAGRSRQAHLLRPAQARRRPGRGRPGEGPDGHPGPQRALSALHGRRLGDPLHAGGRPGRAPGEDSGRGRAGPADRRWTARDLGLLDGRGPHRDPLEHAAGPRRDLRRRGRGAPQAFRPERRVARRCPARGRRGDELQEQGRDGDPRVRRQAPGLPARNALPGRAADPRRAGRPVRGRLRGGVAVDRGQRLRRDRRQPARQLGARRRVPDGDLCRLGAPGRGGRARRRRRRRRARPRGSGASGRRRLELRRHDDQLRHRVDDALQGGHERRGDVQRPGRVRDGPVRARVRAGARDALEEPRRVPQGVVPVPPRGPHHDADALSLRRRGLQRAADQLGADVPGAEEPRRRDASS